MCVFVLMLVFLGVFDCLVLYLGVSGRVLCALVFGYLRLWAFDVFWYLIVSLGLTVRWVGAIRFGWFCGFGLVWILVCLLGFRVRSLSGC